MKKLLFLLSIALLLLTSIAGISTYLMVMEKQILPTLYQGEEPFNVTFKERFLADLKQLEKSPPFKEISYQSNARVLLEKHIPWIGEGMESIDQDNSNNLSTLFNNLKGESVSQKIEKLETAPLFLKIDTNWLNDLKNYDHWSYQEHPYFVEKINLLVESDTLDIINFLAAHPIPDHMSFLHFAIIRFLKEKRQNLEAAYKNYEHALQILFSEGSLIGHNVASVGLSYGLSFKKKFPISGFDYFNEKSQIAFKRASWGWTGVIQKVFQKPVDEEFTKYMKVQNGVCAGAREHIIGFSGFKGLLKKSNWPFEHNFLKEIRRETHLKEKLFKLCHLSVFGNLAKRNIVGISSHKSFFQGEGSTLANVDITSLPYLRRIIWGQIVTVGNPNFLRPYDDDTYSPLDSLVK